MKRQMAGGSLVVILVLLIKVGVGETQGEEESGHVTAADEPAGYYDTQEWKTSGPFTLFGLSEISESGDPSAQWVGPSEGEPRPAKKTRRRKGRRKGRRRKQRPYVPDLSGDTLNTELPAPRAPWEDDHRHREDTEADAHFHKPEDHSYIELPEEEEEHNEDTRRSKSYKRPYSRNKQEDDQATVGSSTDLKALLKQSGGLSLSEVLQQKNLSLSDFLKGKEQAISALQTNDPYQPVLHGPNEEDMEAHSNVMQSNTDPRPRRLPPNNKATKHYTARKTMTSPGRQYAISTIHISETNLREDIKEETPNRQANNPEHARRLPPSDSRKPPRRQPPNNSENQRKNMPRRRLPPTSVRKNRPQQIKQTQEIEKDISESSFVPNQSRKLVKENVIRRTEEEIIFETTELPLDLKSLIESIEKDLETTTEIATTTTVKTTTEAIRNRLSLKPRLRLPTIKHIPRRISHPVLRQKPKANHTVVQEIKKAAVPPQAIPINVKDIVGVKEIISGIENATKTQVSATPAVTTVTEPTTWKTSTTGSDFQVSRDPSAKEEILEVLTDMRGGERLAKILAERNMSLGELVDQRERGSSQLHLADIFHNSSREPTAPEPFLSKSMIEPISKEIYPLKALLEGNMRKSVENKEEAKKVVNNSPPPFIDMAKNSQNEDNLGIVTLFDKFSEFGGHPKIFDPKDIKKDSDGASYFTTVINVKPTKEVYRESRNELGFKSSNKQMSEIYSSLPTYINKDEVVKAKVVPDWNPQHNEHTVYNNDVDLPTVEGKVKPKERDLDGDGLIVLGDLQPIEPLDNHIPQASNQEYLNNGGHDYANEKEQSFYSKLPVGVRSAIMVSSAIVGISLVVFLTIFVACKVRQKRRTLRYDERLGGAAGCVRSPSPCPDTLSSRHHWDSMRKPFQ